MAARLDVRRGMKVEAKWERKWYAATVQTVWEQTCEVRFDIDGTWEEENGAEAPAASAAGSVMRGGWPAEGERCLPLIGPV